VLGDVGVEAGVPLALGGRVEIGRVDVVVHPDVVRVAERGVVRVEEVAVEVDVGLVDAAVPGEAVGVVGVLDTIAVSSANDTRGSSSSSIQCCSALPV
jgi:hypothetical protein